jgi:prolipoprotein diacylglyceryltransferase
LLTLSINIETLNGGFYYIFSYLLSALIIIGYSIFWGVSKKIPLIPWTLSVVTILIFFIAGTLLFSMNKEDWQFFFNSGIIHLSNGRTVLGGIVLVIPAAIFCKHYFKLTFDFSKPFAFVIPIVVVVMRVGCLLVGCCYGTQCDLPWAISYGQNSPAFISQINKGLISFNAPHSLPVHPSQVYDIIFYVMIFFLVIKFRNAFKANHSLFFLMIVSRFIERFFIEFVREGESNNIFGIEFYGLKIVQLILLVLISIFVFIIYYREKNFVQSGNSFQIKMIQSNRIVFYTILISALLIVVKSWLMRLELMVIDLLVLMVIVSVLIYEIKQIRSMRFRFAPISLVLISIVLMSQTLDIRTIKNIPRDSLMPKLKDVFEIGAGYSESNYHMQLEQKGCNGNVVGYDDHTQLSAIQSGALLNKHYVGEKNNSFTFGLNYDHLKIIDYFNFSTSHATYTSAVSEANITDIKPNINFDTRRFGIGVGIHVMQNNIMSNNYVNLAYSAPSIYLRYGNPRFFYCAFFISNRMEFSLPIFYMSPPNISNISPSSIVEKYFGLDIITSEIGSQFNTDNFILRMGIAKDGLYFAPTLYLYENRFAISPFYHFGNIHEIVGGNHVGIKLAYRIPVNVIRY